MPPVEEGLDYKENALAKARAAVERTGEPCLADDSGLEVDGLDGAPGPQSARFGGEGLCDDDRWRLLLERLEGVEAAGRRARFRCVAAAVFPAGRERVVEARWEGRITEDPRGEGGFGYDPVFEDVVSGRTAAEMAPEEKSERSHRGKAFRELGGLLALLDGGG